MNFEEVVDQALAMLQRRIDPKLNLRIGPEEILSDAFLQARRRWSAYQQQPTMKPYPWLYRVTLNTAFSFSRSRFTALSAANPCGTLPERRHSTGIEQR